MTTQLVERLRNVDETMYPETLRGFLCQTEEDTAQQFIKVIRMLRRFEPTRVLFAVAKAMMPFFATEIRSFVLELMECGALGQNRLNVAVTLEFFCLSPMILLDELINANCNKVRLEKAVDSFQPADVMGIVHFVIRNWQDPKGMLEKMQQSADCFRKNYGATIVWSKFKPTQVLSYIEMVCERLDVAFPAEARPLLLQVSMDRMLDCYFKGQIEIQDAFQMCLDIARKYEFDYRWCVDYLRRKSNPLTKFASSTLGISFLPSPEASDFVPDCKAPFHASFHDLASNSAVMIDNDATVEEFRRCLGESERFAVFNFSGVGMEDKPFLLSFRFLRRVFHYSTYLSRKQRSSIGHVLTNVGERQVFVAKKEFTMEVLGTCLPT